jgi:hypothetical protein
MRPPVPHIHRRTRVKWFRSPLPMQGRR